MRFHLISLAVWSCVFLLYIISESEALFKLTNVKCNCYDKTYCEFKKCELKILGRAKVGLNVYVKVHKLPIKKSMWVVTLFRRFNGFKPFLFNASMDICDFYKHQKRFPLFQLIYNNVRNFSNINHSCPYNHDIIIDRLILEDKMLSQFPIPNGIYKLLATVQTDGVWRGEIEMQTEVNLGFDR